MKRFIEKSIKTEVEKDLFTFGDKHPNPVIFPNNTIALIGMDSNSDISILVIENGKILEEPFTPQINLPASDLPPIFKVYSATPKRVEMIGFFPSSWKIIWFDLKSPYFEELVEDIDEMIPKNTLRVESEWDYYFTPQTSRHYIVRSYVPEPKTEQEEYLESIIQNEIYCIKKVSNKKPDDFSKLESFTSANRAMVHQNEDSIVFGMILNEEIHIRIEQFKGQTIRLRFRQKVKYMEMGEEVRVERMVNSLGIFVLEGKRYLSVFYNNDRMQAGAILFNYSGLADSKHHVAAPQQEGGQEGRNKMIDIDEDSKGRFD